MTRDAWSTLGATLAFYRSVAVRIRAWPPIATLAAVGCASHAGGLDTEEPEVPRIVFSRASIPDQTPQHAEQRDERLVVRNEPALRGELRKQSWPDPSEEELRDACDQGRTRAHADDERHHMVRESWGLPTTCAVDLKKVWAERFNLHQVDRGCVVRPEDPRITEHRRCYDQEVDAIVRERHGDDAFVEAAVEAETLCRTRSRRDH